MSALGVGYLAGMFGVVAFGAVVPVVPTGAAVSVAAALSEADNPLLLVLVVTVGAAGAYLGDLVTYAVLRAFGDRLSRRIGWLHVDSRRAALERFQRQISEHELRTLLLSRLVPGGRVPVLLAAALGGYSFRRYVSADVGAATLWAIAYALIGLAGRSIFPEPWQGVVAAIALVILVSLAAPLWRRATHRRTAPDPTTSIR